MDQKIKKLWLEALRSGVYQQSTSALYYAGSEIDHSGYCCLGVLCDVTGNGYFDPHAPDSRSWGLPTGNSNGMALTLPHELREEFGIEAGADDMLAELNDGRRLTFAQIADWIEASL